MGLKIHPKDLIIERIKRSGPGGQHRNKRETGIRLKHIPSGMTAMATTERSQKQNLDKAIQRLQIRLEKKMAIKKKRKATKPSRSSKEKRLQNKKHRSEKKNLRKNPST